MANQSTGGMDIETSALRDWVQQSGLLPLVRDARDRLQRRVGNWVDMGCPSPAPNAVKFRVVRHHVTAFRTPVFIETGTYLGSMTDFIARTGVQCHTIEIVPAIHERARQILARHRNVTLHLGDSGVVLPALLRKLDRPATFWLDGHYSGSFTGRSDLDSPVSAEVDAILSHHVPGHVILIDDAREFTGQGGYPRLSELLAHFEGHPTYRADVSTDIIRILPR